MERHKCSLSLISGDISHPDLFLADSLDAAGSTEVLYRLRVHVDYSHSSLHRNSAKSNEAILENFYEVEQ